MTPLIMLINSLPIIAIVVVLAAIVRLIIRLSKNKTDNANNSQTNYNPQQYGNTNPGNTNPGANPFGQQNPYNQPGTNYPPSDPNLPPTYQQPGNYTPPNYSQPTYQHSAPNPQGTTRRSTQIPGGAQYSTYIQDQPKNKNRTGLILGIIFGVVALFGAAGWFIFAKASAARELTTSDFKLAYENPTDESYLIILDGWDSIKVEPRSASTDLDYTIRTDQDTFRWRMETVNGNVIADTMIERIEVESWYYDQLSKGYAKTPTIVFNPSKTEFVFWTLWYGEEGIDYCEDMVIGDSTYWIDAYMVNNAIIFDDRDPDAATDLGDAKKYSSEDQAQFLVNVKDFAILYERIYSDANDQLDIFNDYRNSLIELYNAANEMSQTDGNLTYNEEKILNDFDATIPPTIDENTVPRDFVDAIDYVQTEPDFFTEADANKYEAVVDSADIILKHAYVEEPRTAFFSDMHYVSYLVKHEGFWNNIPMRSVSYTMDRDPDGEVAY